MEIEEDSDEHILYPGEGAGEEVTDIVADGEGSTQVTDTPTPDETSLLK